MRKILVGALAGLTLIGSQAVAAGATQPLAVGDRVGAVVGASSRNFQSDPGRAWFQQPLVIGGIIAAAVAVPLFFNNDDDDPVSN